MTNTLIIYCVLTSYLDIPIATILDIFSLILGQIVQIEN